MIDETVRNKVERIVVVHDSTSANGGLMDKLAQRGLMLSEQRIMRISKGIFQSKLEMAVQILLNTVHLTLFLRKARLFLAPSVTNVVPLLIARFIRVDCTPVVIVNFYLHQLSENRWVASVLRVLFDNNVSIILQSPYEITEYKRKYPRVKAYFVPYCQDPVKLGDGVLPGQGAEEYVFAGGYTNRDYRTYIEAARALPYKFVAVCSHLNNLPEDLPENVEIYRDVSREKFHKLMVGASVIVLNLERQVGSSGQMVALAAMSLGKPVVFADNKTISYYFEDGKSGIAYRMKDPVDLREKVLPLMERPELRRILGSNAYDRYMHAFTSRVQYDSISRIIHSML